MNQLKPNWRFAQQISRRHTLISLGISVPLFLTITILAIVGLKLYGIPDSGVYLKNYVDQHKALIFNIMFFIHFVPINFYAIIRVFKTSYPDFQLLILANDDGTDNQKLDDNVTANR